MRLALIFCASALFVALPTSASAQVLDPTKIVKDTTDKVGDIVKDTTDKVGGVLKETTETVEEVVAETKKKVDKTAGQVHDTIDRVIDEAGGVPSQPTEPQPNAKEPRGNVGAPEPRQGAGRKHVKRERTSTGSSVREKPSRAAPGTNGTQSRTFNPVSRRTDISAAPAADIARDSNRSDGSSTSPAEAAQRLAFPLFMIVTVIAFLLVQGRIDRRDPKLLFDIDVDSESLSFE
jgi:hypothetical protein